MKSKFTPKVVYFLFYLLTFLSLSAALFGTTVLTEAGQMLNLPREWLVDFFRYRIPISVASASL